MLKTFEVEPGFRLELVASEPLVSDPIAMAFDEFGRLFVVEMRGYSEDGDKSLGRVCVLEDTSGDGTFDKRSVYVDSLSWPTAVACYDGGIFVGAAPDIYYCKDRDGDGKADLVERVFTGFGRQNVQGLLNSFQWGLDNRIHGSTSSNGGSIKCVKVPTHPTLSLRGRDFALDPKSLRMEPTSGGGQHGMTFDQWGEKFVCSNSDHIQHILIEDRYLARNPYYAAQRAKRSIAADGPAADVFRRSRVEPWRIVRTRLRVKGIVKGPIEGGGRAAGYFTSATGLTIYRGDAFKPSYLGSAFVGDVGGNLIHRKAIEPHDLNLVAVRKEQDHEFIASNDIWFRPVQFANAPDGTLYVCDMYREVIEHPLSLPPVIKRHLDLTSGRERGRIYRIVPDEFRHPSRLMPGQASREQLVSMLAHRNGWHRETAARLICERGDRSVAPLIEKLALTCERPFGVIRALHVLDTLERLSESTLLALLDSPHPRVREHAIRLSEPLLSQSPALRGKLLSLVSDSEVASKELRVQRQLALSLGGISIADRRERTRHDRTPSSPA